MEGPVVCRAHMGRDGSGHNFRSQLEKTHKRCRFCLVIQTFVVLENNSTCSLISKKTLRDFRGNVHVIRTGRTYK